MWPAISWAVLDYTGFRKLAWHAMKSAYQPRAIVVGRVDQGAQITLLNDLPDPWKTKVELSLIDKNGVVAKTHTIDVNLDRYSVSRTPATEIFPEIADGNYEGFILATCPEVRASRRTTLAPAKESPLHDLTAKTAIENGVLKVQVIANTYIHELSFMPELLALGTQVDSQIVSLLPGDSHTFSVTGNATDIAKIAENVDDLLWSHNRIVNQ
jgi:beta-mannosidase